MRLQISFTPELFRFGMNELEDDTVALMRKRVYDMAGVLGKVEVWVPIVTCSCCQLRQHDSRTYTQLILHHCTLDVRQFTACCRCTGTGPRCRLRTSRHTAACTWALTPRYAAHERRRFRSQAVLSFSVVACMLEAGVTFGGEFMQAGLYEKPNDRWEVCVAPTDGPFQQVCGRTLADASATLMLCC